ncbi:LGFP repeat-containing protein [Nocardia callitridis]|uniref:LGFP repeat-containing protein n=1 Tax=Nocardia callitridis TaxID=648753 RepID=UPI0031EA731E
MIAAAALVAIGCSDDNDNPASDAVGSATSAVGGAAESATNGAETPTESGASGESATSTSGAEAGQETKVATPNGEEITVSGGIYEKYVGSGGPEGTLGAPLQAEESAPEDGKFQDFTGGTIYEPKEGEPHIVWGEIRKAWEENGGASGELGYPTSDEQDIQGGKQSDFTGGTITWVDGQTTVTPK